MSSNEVNTGWRAVLTSGLVYRIVQFVFSESRSKALILNTFIHPVGKGCRVLDIGCGPGNLPKFIPADVSYTGFDVSPHYIETARTTFANRANTQFFCASAEDIMVHPEVADDSYDLAIVHGVFHHVDDTIATQMLDLAGKKLKPGGNAVILEPVWFNGQSRLRRWVMTLDRGKNIKQEEGWVTFFSDATKNWGKVSCSIEQNLIRFYDLIVCRVTKG